MLIILLLIVLDQLTKLFFMTTKNYGAAFGILEGYTTLLIIISLVVLGFCIYYYKQKELRVGLNFLIAGIIGNLIDRIMFGYVRDFIGISIFPVFNLADSFNVFGVVLLTYITLKK